MKKTLTILAALALGVGPGIQVSFAADPAVDALRPAVGGIVVVGEGETKTGSDFEDVWSIAQNEGAEVWDRTALVKDGQGTLVIDQNTTINHSFVVREGTMIIKDAALTNTTPLESPNLTVGGTHAHLVLDGGSYEHAAVDGSAIVVGGRDGDGSLTLTNGAKLSNQHGLFAGYPSKDALAVPPDPNQYTDAHVAGTYLTSDGSDERLYRNQNPDAQFSSDYVYSGGDPARFYMSKATINILSGSQYSVGTAIYSQNLEMNIDGQGSALIVGTRATGVGLDSSIGCGHGSDNGNYQPSAVINVSGGALLQFNSEVFMSYGSGNAEIHVSGTDSQLRMMNALYNFASSEYASRSQLTISDGAQASIPYHYIGGGVSAQDSRVLVVGKDGSYRGSAIYQDSNSLVYNENSLELADGQCNFAPSGWETKAVAATLYVGEGAYFVNTADATLSVNSESEEAFVGVDNGGYLINDGTMESDVTCYLAGTLAGGGEMGSVVAAAGSVIYAGGVPVYEDGVSIPNGVVATSGSPHFDALELQGGSKLVFFVDGDVAATEQNAGAGTYSNISVAKGGLTVKEPGSVSADLVLGSRAFKTALSREDKAIPLQLVSEQAESADGAATDRTLELDLEYALSGERAELFSVDETGMLRLVLSPDAVTAATVYGAADLLNSLWTSTGMVQDFARKALMTQTPARLSFAQPRRPEGSEHVTGIDLWGSGLGYFSNMGGAQGFDFNSGGYAVGCDAELLRESTQSARVGLAFGQSFGTFKSDIGSKVDQEALMFALYGGAERKLSDRTSLYLGAYAAYGRVDNDARTRFMEGSAGYADWDDDVWSFGLQAELNFKVSDYFTVSPFTGIDYVYGSHGSFLEDFGDGLRRSYSSGSMQVWRVPVGVRLSTMVELGGNQVLLPELSVAYVGDISRSNPHATVDVAGAKARVRGSNPGRSALMLQAGATWIMNDRWSTGAAYHLEARSGQTAQGVNAYVRYRF